MASNIPRAREIIFDVIKNTNDNKARIMLQKAVVLMMRKKYTRTSIKSEPMSEEKKAEIIAMKNANPDFSRQEIANRLGINPGRVSEVLNPS